MLYKFKSQATGDVVMLQPNAEELLKIIGKSAGPTGIITVEQCGPAIAALRAEIQRREAHPEQHGQADQDPSQDPADHEDPVTLRRRAAPFIELLERSSAAGKDVVWGV
ncbi:MAG TPA: DUF1840 domain-containing protein [Ottowia sp.]|uniref:DUF1840 domain-containing protein n=1 Tax=Ottowia sp. TaxID=1898956 RepID=UPI002BC71C25|nr:DUF1840 domain-containing protein [Ottowia sp.]HMN21357.1 DUF1840 domain-containing protein [Ottowia sp.]